MSALERAAREAAAARPERSADHLRILLTLADVPTPTDTGKRLRAAAVLEGLRRLGEVDTLVVTVAQPLAPTGVTGASSMGFERLDLPLRPRSRAALSVLARALPWQIAVRDWRPALDALAARGPVPYDLVWFGALDHARMLRRHVRTRHVIVDADDVETFKAAAFLALPAESLRGRRLERLQRRIELPLWARLQRRVAHRADAVVVCSELDAARYGGDRTAVVPNVYPDPGGPLARRPDAERPVLLMIASYDYEPNADGARFAASVLALVRRELPRAVLRLVGRGVETLTDLVGVDGVELIGYVAEVEDELVAASVVIAPIRYGGGTRLKIIEAFARGVPVVSTPLGCEGLAAVPGWHLAVADGRESFAEACVTLVRDRVGAAEMATRARQLYERAYLPVHASEAIEAVVASIISQPRGM